MTGRLYLVKNESGNTFVTWHSKPGYIVVGLLDTLCENLKLSVDL